MRRSFLKQGFGLSRIKAQYLNRAWEASAQSTATEHQGGGDVGEHVRKAGLGIVGVQGQIGGAGFERPQQRHDHLC